MTRSGAGSLSLRALFAVLCTAGSLAALSPARGSDVAPLEVTESAAGVFVHAGVHEETTSDNLGDIANIGFIVGEKCVAVIDSGGSPAVGRALAAAVRSRTSLPVCYVINTHMHPDHVFGNAAFLDAAPRPRFVGSVQLPQALAARDEHYRAALAAALGTSSDSLRLVPPDLLVDAPLRLDLGGRVLSLQRWPTAHTDNDLTVFDETTGTLWLGDLLFDQRIPSIDGSIKGWLEVSARLRELPARQVIPGHGRIAPPWPATLDTQTRYLEQVVARVRDALARGLTLQQTVEASDAADASAWRLAEGYHRRNLTAAYAELEWE
ncbi:MAG: quinoprotein relay system zinc metallohydrolase 2 [Aromatoleum sp.]|jgi:quinoprotein relay system zinc metallohydrolase 2|uniref:quinoprotein relay system zinc metallohydrolase 2 n=1 Tax=Aromatoleum sp. TaxID=2307007 RepID=UPI0028946D46|nr:quinoprotein relay system zinc metallohydrolase 2 [Aromatoleum sp.]MDT3672116.1 quinoprotein relay system zinc metallohydrolase 2 [Aromatoleum sp.]